MDREDRFKAAPAKKAVKAAETPKKFDESNMADLDISKDEDNLNKDFIKIMDREDRFKATPAKKAAKAVVSSSKSNDAIDVSDLEPSKD
jgi:hypothetical protein